MNDNAGLQVQHLPPYLTTRVFSLCSTVEAF